jgi:hypothetical protein
MKTEIRRGDTKDTNKPEKRNNRNRSGTICLFPT